MTPTLAVTLAIFSLLCTAAAMVGLPGTWVVIVLAILAEWASPGLVGFPAITILIGLATLGEVLEFLSGALGASKAGGSRRSIVGAVVGGLAGAVLGTPIAPIVGTILGSVVGAGIGAAALELTSAGRREVKQRARSLVTGEAAHAVAEAASEAKDGSVDHHADAQAPEQAAGPNVASAPNNKPPAAPANHGGVFSRGRRAAGVGTGAAIGRALSILIKGAVGLLQTATLVVAMTL